MNVRNILVVDTETTGLEDDATVIEIGAALFNVPSRTWTFQLGFLARHHENPAEHVNGISVLALEESVPSLARHGGRMLLEMVMEADLVLAQNAEFDRPKIERHFPELATKPWACTKADFEWPKSRKPGESLVVMAVNHGVAIANAHRALSDVMLLCEIMHRVDDLEERIEKALRPKQLYQAMVSFQDKDKAKAAGFQWTPDVKQWTKKLTEEDAKALPFQVRRIG